MHGNEQEFLQGIASFLGAYYISLGLMNGVAALYLWKQAKRGGWALVWTIVAIVCAGVFAPFAGSAQAGWVPALPEAFRNTVDSLSRAEYYTTGTILALVILFLGRNFFIKPMVAWSGLNASLILMGFSMADPEFAAIVTKPDNVPIVALIFLLGFFTWLATFKAVENDRRAEQGLPPLEKEGNEKVLVWPDLVYVELICMILLTAVLLLWAIGLQAPLEEPANSVKTPNPSKAPWYFLGLQEMLVYFDPWYAGVVLPSLVVIGLMAIPYLDFNKKGNGYYTIKERRFSYLIFQFGFLELWITLIILGTFLRGPNWNFFGPYEIWDKHKVLALNNVDLSQLFWENLLNRSLPKAPSGSSKGTQLLYILYRESPGILSIALYLIVLPPLLAVTLFKRFFVKMGFIRYLVMVNLFLLMFTLPIKMICRWNWNLKYIVSIPEYFLNF